MAGTIVFDSTGDASGGEDKNAQGGGTIGFSFTTASGFPGTLSDVKVDLGDASAADGGTVTVYLYSDTGGPGPGTQLATLGTVSDSSLGTTGLASFAISSTINLSAGTRYWIVVADSANSQAFLEFSSAYSGTGVPGEFYWSNGTISSNSQYGADIGQVTETLNNSDQVPVVTTSSGATAFVAGAGPVAVDNAINVTDADNTTLASAKVSITGNFQSGQDVLAFANTWRAISGSTTRGSTSSCIWLTNCTACGGRSPS